MESVHIVGITLTILIDICYLSLSNKLDRIEKKLNNIQEQLTTQNNANK